MAISTRMHSSSAEKHDDVGLDLDWVGPYQIVAPIGSGGFGSVYKAIDRKRDHTVAIKVLRRRSDDGKKHRRRDFLETEIKMASHLVHENVVRVLDHLIEQEDKDGRPRRCLVMEYVDGFDLRTFIRNRNPSLPQSIDVAVKLCRGLDFLHQHGIVHKDVKPENVLLSRDGCQVKIGDFGLAEAQSWWTPWRSRVPGLARTQMGGTQIYMSPEQLLGRHVDHRSDIFSLGITLYELFTGRHPCPGPSKPHIVKQICSHRHRIEPPSKFNRDIPKWLDHVVLTSLRRSTHHRYQSVALVWFELTRQMNFPTLKTGTNIQDAIELARACMRTEIELK